MKKHYVLLLFLLGLLNSQSEAQDSIRYLHPVFDDVTVTPDIVYGVNASMLGMLVGDTEARPEDLLLDLYEPTGDILEERPLVLLFHNGNFLPPAFTGLPTGTKEDNALVDIATKLAKRGYVVASCNYRLGWNGAADNTPALLFGIMNAAYRAIQDGRTAIRFFKKEADTYGIDPNKIVLWGNGTGGFISLGAASLDNYEEEIVGVLKFYPYGEPVVVDTVNGDIYGTSVGIVPDFYPYWPFPAGDTLNYPNHVAYSSDFQMAVNMGGAVGDISWVDENTVPTVSFHVKTDQSTSCYTEIVTTPPPNNIPIIEVSGSCDYQTQQALFNNQTEWDGVDWLEDYGSEAADITSVADSRNDGLEGFLPFETDSIENNAPWDWWQGVNPALGLSDQATAQATIDSALLYFLPRACITLGLDCKTTAIDEIVATKIDLRVFPNPASNRVHFTSKEFPMEFIRIYDLTGRLVKEYQNIKEYTFEMQKGNLGNGVYFAQVWFEEGFISKQIIFQD